MPLIDTGPRTEKERLEFEKAQRDRQLYIFSRNEEARREIHEKLQKDQKERESKKSSASDTRISNDCCIS